MRAADESRSAGLPRAEQSCIIVGAGPAGLTAALQLSKAGFPVTVFEHDSIVGGISRTESYKGFRYDIGGHRFFTKVQMVNDFWMEILPDDFIKRPRLSRIYYNDRFFDYPLKPWNALRGLGVFEAVRCVLSYAKAQVFPSPSERNFEQWVSNRFGQRLFQIFFKTYTEKVWGMSCSEISADWAAQRIKSLDLRKAILNAFLGDRAQRGEVVTTLIDEFHYPRLGPGMMWERVAALLAERGSPPVLETGVEKLHHDGTRVTAVTVMSRKNGRTRVEGEHFLSSMPIRDLLRAFDPPPPPAVLEAANKLRYRDYLTVCVIIDAEDTFPDNWIYIHSPKVKVGRIQNYKSWSPEMVPDPSKSSLGLEYFVQEGDELWSATDADLIELGKRELALLGLVEPEQIIDGTVIRMPKAYPVYDDEYQHSLEVIRAYLAAPEFANLQLMGRNGQHRYNNQDHSMVTAMYSARNVCGENLDPWDVNVDDEYHEEVRDTEATKAARGGDRLVPLPVQEDPIQELLAESFARYDAVALGTALGSVLGVGVFLAVAVLLIRGGEVVGPNLAALGAYLIGFQVSWVGAVVGLVEGFAIGFGLGYPMARLINAVIRLHERSLLRELEIRAALDSPLDV